MVEFLELKTKDVPVWSLANDRRTLLGLAIAAPAMVVLGVLPLQGDVAHRDGLDQDAKTYLPLVVNAYRLSPTPTPVCRDQDPGDLSEPGNPLEATQYDSPDIGAIWRDSPQNFDVFQREMHNRPVTVAIAKDFEMADLTRQGFAEFVFETWAIYWREFGGFPWDSYTVILGYSLPYVDVGDFGRGVVSSVARTDWTSHAIYHAWNGCAFRQAGERTWFMEGVTTYHGNLRQQTRYPYESICRSIYDQYIEGWGPQQAEPLADMSMNDDDYDHELVALKGALVTYLLDLELQKTGHHLGEVARLIYQRYGIESLGRPTNEEILSIFNEVSGADFTDFFGRYVYGIERLPLSEDTHFEWVCHD